MHDMWGGAPRCSSPQCLCSPNPAGAGSVWISPGKCLGDPHRISTISLQSVYTLVIYYAGKREKENGFQYAQREQTSDEQAQNSRG